MKSLIIALILSTILLASTHASATNYKNYDHDIDIDNRVDVLHETNVLRDRGIDTVILRAPEVTTTGYGDGVFCPEPTVGLMAAGNNDDYMIGTGISAPLSFFFGEKCPMGEMKMVEQEAKMIKICNELHETNWVDQESRVHEVCDKYIPTHKHNSPDHNGDKKRVSTHNH